MMQITIVDDKKVTCVLIYMIQYTKHLLVFYCLVEVDATEDDDDATLAIDLVER
jgi:hypothetical protein